MIMMPVRRTQNWLPSIFNDFFDNDWMVKANATAPAINVFETEKEYKVELVAPGMTKEDFNVHIDEENNLVISMEKKTENKEEKKEGRYLRREFSYSKFQQTMILPDDVDKEKISAIDARVFLPYLGLLLYLMITELYLKKENPIGNWAYAMLSQLYVALPFALLNVLAFQNSPETSSVTYNPILPLSIFVFIWLSDTGAYCVGSLIGKHRLFERISPKKSWEGSIGGAVFSIASSFVFARFFPFMSMWQWAGLAVIVVIFGTWGDLTESLMKRQLGIKDSGNILPGHGGMLDRFDSALMAIPAAVVYLYILTMI